MTRNDKRQQAQPMERISFGSGAKLRGDRSHVPKLLDDPSRCTGHEYEREEVEITKGQQNMEVPEVGGFPSEKC